MWQQQQPSCMWSAQQQRSADTRGGFSFTVDLGLVLHTSRGLANVRLGSRTAESPQLSLGGYYFCCEHIKFVQDVRERAGAAVAPPELQSAEAAEVAGSRAISQRRQQGYEVNARSFSAYKHVHRQMHNRLGVIRACCAPLGSLPQDWRRSTCRRREARDSCWGKMHQRAWLKAIISRCGVWNGETRRLQRNQTHIYLHLLF